jgi:hypothetical protein
MQAAYDTWHAERDIDVAVSRYLRSPQTGSGGPHELANRIGKRTEKCRQVLTVGAPYQDDSMQIGMMGLGRMGANMVRRMLRGGHECVVYDINPANVEALVKEGATGASSLEEFVSKLTPPKTAWLMLPAAITGKMADEVAALGPGDIVV